MKKLIAILMLVMSAQSFAYLPKIKNWSDSFELKEKEAAQMIYDFYIFSVWWEDEGYECGGDFSLTTLVEQSKDTYIIEGEVTVVQNYCAYTSDAEYKVKIEKVDGKYEISELYFVENDYYKK